MTDVTTEKPLRVLDGGMAGPYFWTPFIQLEEIQRVLDSHSIRYWVGEHSISVDGGPEFGLINLGKNGDAATVQAALDSCP